MKNPYIYLLRLSWKYAKGQKKLFVVAYLLFFIANVGVSLKPLLYGWFINSLQVNGEDAISYAWQYVGMFLGIYLFGWIIQGPGRLIERKLAFDIGKNFLDDLFFRVLHLPISWHKNNHTGSTLDRMRKGEMALKGFFQNGYSYLQIIIQLTISFLAIVFFSPIFGLIAVCSGILIVTIIVLFDKPYLASLNKINEGEHAVSASLADSLRNIITIITLKLEGQIHSELLKKVCLIYSSYRRNTVVGEVKWFVAGLLVDFTYCVMVVGYVYANYEPGRIFLIGGLVTLLGFIDQFAGVFLGIAYQYNHILKYRADVDSTSQILQISETLHQASRNDEIITNWQTISIRKLSFAYDVRLTDNPGSEHLATLRMLNFDFKKPQRIALIGSSGSGKSTVMSVLKGLYAPLPESYFLIDGLKSQEWSRLSETVTLFPQQPEVFENTVRYNLTLGLVYDDKELYKACTLAGFLDVLNDLDGGLEHVIQENGNNLSGGQKQRLALARGILSAQESSMILMDEATSNVDQTTEELIYESLFSELKNHVFICSIHKMQLLKFFDYVYVLDNGTIKSEGPAPYVINMINNNFIKY